MPDKERAKEELKKLIEKYHKQKSEIANEEQVCQSLILPLFSKVLGWDTENPSEFKAQYSKHGKRSDYVVFLNGISQFVIEAKALDREIKQTYQDYEQAINYAKNKEKDFAILTNFKHFIVLRADTEALPLQCEVKAINIEKAAEKEEDFNIIWNFQKEVWSAEKGDALYRLKPGRKVEPVSKRLVEDMRKWRSALLNNIRKHGRLNDFADFDKERPYIEQEIQRFIDRLIFICYCEDKELKEKELKGLLELKESKNFGKESFLVNEVKELFKDYRVHYDSDLFFEQGYCDQFRFEDSVLTEIIRDLRKPSKKLPYNFADIEADVLGKAYENFIGHIITGEKRFGEKESRSKRKEEGVYYTPQYIVNYIVDNTLREYIKEKNVDSFNELLKIKVLDPACGSGTFLIRAFEVLEEEARRILGKDLGYDEKVKLLTSCVFGVDKDERAVDITKLRLSLALAARQKLPELGKNIQCGDSLIDDDAVVTDGKALNWNEQFKEIIQNGGFDVVIGNPPYVEHKKLKEFSGAFKISYEVYSGTADLYVYFYEKALKVLKEDGVLGFITSNKFMKTAYGAGLRGFLSKLKIIEITDFTNVPVFEALVASSIIILRNQRAENNSIRVTFVDDELITLEDLPNFIANKAIFFSQSKLDGNIWKLEDDEVLRLKEKIDKKATKIKQVEGVNVYRGVTTGFNPAFVIDSATRKVLISEDAKSKEIIKPLLQGRDIRKWFHKPSSEFLIQTGFDLDVKETYTTIFKHLNRYKNELKDRADQGRNWWNLRACKYYSEFEKEKIIWGLTADKWAFAYDDERHYLPSNGYILTSRNVPLKFILAQLNSSLLRFYFKIIGVMTAGGAYTLKHETILELPILIEGSKKGKIAQLVDNMLSLNKRLNELGDKHTVERERIEEGIKKTDAEIDELVYQIYGITEEEKKIIEDSLK